MQEAQNAIQNEDNTTERQEYGTPKKIMEDKFRVLVMEDDLTFKPFWMHILKTIVPHAEIDWVISEEAADHWARQSREKGLKYNLVIADVFLSGRKTAVDFWNDHSSSVDQFVFVSSLPKDRFNQILKFETFNYPVYLQKPLNVQYCTGLIRELLEK